MKKALVTALSLLAVTLAPVPALAAVRLEFHLVSEGTRGAEMKKTEGKDTIYVSDTHAISENRARSIILDLDKQEMIFVYHAERVYEVARLPFRLEDYATDEEARNLEVMTTLASPVVEVTEGSDLVKRGSWQAREVHVEATAAAAGFQLEMELLLSSDPEINYGIYDSLSLNSLASSVFLRDWSRQIVDLEGIAIYQKIATKLPGISRVEVKELVSVEEVEMPADKLRPPEGYREVPLAVSRYFKTGGSTLPRDRR